MEELKITSNELITGINYLAKQILESPTNYESMLVLNRGSMIIAGILAYRLEIRNIQYIDINLLYADNYTKVVSKTINTKLLKGNLTGKTLLVTDVAHTGNTIQEGLNMFNETYPNNTIDFATMYYMESSKVKPNYYTRKFSKKVWIVFPWDSTGYTPMSNHI